MRYQEIITEMAPHRTMQAKFYYHGTSEDDKGRSILANGLKPGNDGPSRGHLTPVGGKTYITDDLRYAIIYCIGGNMLGCSENDLKYLTKKGDHGWVFAISGEKLKSDVHPDEDSVGEAVLYIDCILKGKNYFDNNRFYQNLKNSDSGKLRYFLSFAKSSMTAKQFSGSIDGLYAAWATGGKRMLKTMPPNIQAWLIDCGAHVAYSGPIMPDRAWRFDKRLTPKLLKDGSNFFELAEEISMKKIVEAATMTAIPWLQDDPAMISRLLDVPIEVVNAAQKKLLSLVKKGHMEAWRAVMLNNVLDLQAGDRVGNCYAFTRHLAIPYDAGKRGRLYRFHTSIPIESVDLPETIRLWGSGEDEIRMLEGKPLTFLSVDQVNLLDRVIEPNCRPDLVGATMFSGPAV